MRRVLMSGAVAVLAGGWATAQIVPARGQPVPAARPAVAGPVSEPASFRPGLSAAQRALQSELTVSGTVSMGTDTVEAAMYLGQPQKTTYKVATIQVADVLVGDKPGDTLKVLVPPVDPAVVPMEFPGRPMPRYQVGVGNVQLIDGQEGAFFLSRHPNAAGYYQVNIGHVPLNPLDTDHAEDLAQVKQVAAIVADPLKALKADKPADRYEAAVVLVNRYRLVYSPGHIAKEEVAVPEEESKLILKAIGEFDWSEFDRPINPGDPPRDFSKQPNQLITLLGILQGRDGFPRVQVQPGQGFFATYQQVYKDWLTGAGAKFQVKKYVPSKK